jgi:hypothetical protein
MSLLLKQQPPAASTGHGPSQAPPRHDVPVFSDGLGERTLSLDHARGVTVEVLRVRRELADAPDFESALRKRVDELGRLYHPSLAALCRVDRLPHDGGLILTSDHVTGRRLSEIVQSARGSVFALELIRQLAPALAALQRLGLSHGLISADRVIVTREGRLVVVEQAFGSAIETLRLPAAELRSTFGLAVGDTAGPVVFDSRHDVIQLGFVALSLLLGRRLDPSAFRAGIPSLLNEFSVASPRDAGRMRPWFERALQIAEQPFESAEDLVDSVDGLPANDDAPQKDSSRSVTLLKAPVVAAPPPQPLSPAATAPLRAVPAREHVPDPASAAEVRGHQTTVIAVETPDEFVSEHAEDDARTESMKKGARGSRALTWVAAGFALVSVAEAAVIANLLINQPTLVPPPAAASLQPAVTSPPAPVAGGPAAPAGATAMAGSPAVTSPVPAPAPPPVAPPPPPEQRAEAAAQAAPPLAGRFGGIRVSAPVDLQVFQDGTLLGTTAAPIALTEGNYTLDLISEPLGFRSRQTVTVKAGQLTGLKVALPQGRININATPWANVWINGNAAGETPIANLSLPIGTHEIVFRHPQLGEQRMTAVVKAEGITRISAGFQR